MMDGCSFVLVILIEFEIRRSSNNVEALLRKETIANILRVKDCTACLCHLECRSRYSPFYL